MANTSANPEMKPFLQLEEDTEAKVSGIWSDDEDLSRRHGGSQPSRLRRTPLWLHLMLLLVNVILLLWNGTEAIKTLGPAQDTNITTGARSTFSPAESIMYDTVEDYVPSSPRSSPFTGEWRPAVDEAWSKLLQPSTIRLSQEEMEAMNKTSVALRDESGYAGYLETFHMLHCVKRFYQLRNKEHYTDVQETGGLSPAHLDHCLEILREGIMCNAEAKVNTWAWQTSDELMGMRGGPRKCTNWESFFSWASSRAIGFSSLKEFHAMLIPQEQS